jgi:hypothetical protein
MVEDAAKVASTYFDAWKVDDFDTMRSLVDDDITFAGPLAQLEGAQDYMEGIKGMSRIKSDIVIRKTFVDGPDVLTWYDLHTTVASPVPRSSRTKTATEQARTGGGPLKRGKEERGPPNAVTLITLLLPRELRLCQVTIIICTRWPFLSR